MPRAPIAPSQQVYLSVGEGQMINLPRSVANVWTSNPKVADVYVSSPRQMNVFGKEMGEATVIATAADGSVVYGAAVRVNQNITSIDAALRQAMPGFGHHGDARSARSRSSTAPSPRPTTRPRPKRSSARCSTRGSRKAIRSTSSRSTGSRPRPRSRSRSRSASPRSTARCSSDGRQPPGERPDAAASSSASRRARASGCRRPTTPRASTPQVLRSAHRLDLLGQRQACSGSTS